MIEKEIRPIYQLKCDGCSEVFEYDDCTLWFSQEDPITYSQIDEDWWISDEGDYCPSCYSYDEDGEKVIAVPASQTTGEK